MIPTVSEPKHCVAVIGGAVAGSTAAQVLADAGVVCVVFEQNDRPYGKIEDGLPRWHVKQRKAEYKTIDDRLDKPNIVFVPRTCLGKGLDFTDLLQNWGFSLILLANGAWKDRPLPVEGVDRYIGNGLIYQNPFIYWFNHKNEKAYNGPRYAIGEGIVVIGGGLASIDVVKAVQVEVYENALRARGIETSMVELEHEGIPAVCAHHGIDPASLGVKDCSLYYRRRAVDMPLAQPPDNATPEQIARTEGVRQKLLSKVLEKFRVNFFECHLPTAALTRGDRLTGLRFVRTQVQGRSAAPIPGSETDVAASLVISSIGSIPESIPGVEMKGDFYCFKDWDTGEYAKAERVFGVGNVVTGQGNILVSRKHASFVANHLLEHYLGVAEGERDISPAYRAAESGARQQLEPVQAALHRQAPLPAAQVNAILARVEERLISLGCPGYREWIAKTIPPDLE